MTPVLRPRLTAEERAARHRLIARDTLALSTLLIVVLALIFLTYALFHSFTAYRGKLEARWKARGEAALANHQPVLAIDSLHSALAYAPDDRTLQMELATALAAAGSTQEALVYFNTLHESEPGNGSINLQLARLAVSQGNVPSAVTQYQAALDGTWNGDGFLRRREVRLELARYLIAQQRFDEARNQLLIAAGNAADNHALQLTVAALLEQAQGDADAYNLYRKAMAYSDTRTAALIGAGRTAAAQSRYLLTRNLLGLATVQPDFARLPDDLRATVRTRLAEAVAILDIFPAENLPLHVRAVRVAYAVHIVQAQIAACSAAPASAALPQAKSGADNPASALPTPAATPAQPANNLPATINRRPVPGALGTALTAVQHAGSTLTGRAAGDLPAPTPFQPDALSTANALEIQWQQLPPEDQLARRLERDPELLESTLQLVYEMEQQQAQHTSVMAQEQGSSIPGCVPPTRDSTLLLKIANAPDEIDRQ